MPLDLIHTRKITVMPPHTDTHHTHVLGHAHMVQRARLWPASSAGLRVIANGRSPTPGGSLRVPFTP
jgi:hypothetical protein